MMLVFTSFPVVDEADICQFDFVCEANACSWWGWQNIYHFLVVEVDIYQFHVVDEADNYQFHVVDEADIYQFHVVVEADIYQFHVVDEADIYQFHVVDEADMTVFTRFTLLLRLILTSFM